MKASGTHLLAEFDSCSSRLLSDAEGLRSILERSIERSGLSLVSTHSHLYDPLGLTVVSIISESHVLLHTFPEAQHVTVDVFTCASDATKTQALLRALAEELQAARTRCLEVQRGELLEVRQENKISALQSGACTISLPITQRLFSGQSAYQQIDVIESGQFGRMLLLDNHLQLHQGSHQRYIDAMLRGIDTRALRSTLLLGCGTLKLSAVSETLASEALVLSDFDPDVLMLLREFFLPMSRELTEVTSRKYHELPARSLPNEMRFDAVFVDMPLSVDAYGIETREQFFSRVFRQLSNSLTPSGSLQMHCGAASDEACHTLLTTLLQQEFSQVEFQKVEVPLSLGASVIATARTPRNQ